MTDQNNKGESMKKQEANKILLRYKRADDKKAIKLASEDLVRPLPMKGNK